MDERTRYNRLAPRARGEDVPQDTATAGDYGPRDSTPPGIYDYIRVLRGTLSSLEDELEELQKQLAPVLVPIEESDPEKAALQESPLSPLAQEIEEARRLAFQMVRQLRGTRFRLDI